MIGVPLCRANHVVPVLAFATAKRSSASESASAAARCRDERERRIDASEEDCGGTGVTSSSSGGIGIFPRAE